MKIIRNIIYIIMDSIETIDEVFNELYNKIQIYTKSKYNSKLKKELDNTKKIILELEGSNCIDIKHIMNSIEPKNMLLR